jgi:hypothetical protein
MIKKELTHMNLKRALCASSIAAGVGVAGLFGTAIATANAAPATCSSSAQCAAGPSVKLDHHQRKEVGKQAKKEAKGKQEVTPASASHLH